MVAKNNSRAPLAKSKVLMLNHTLVREELAYERTKILHQIWQTLQNDKF